MILTLMVLAFVTVVSTTVAVVTINDLQSASRARQGGVALNAAEAGVAQALSYMRNSGVRDICETSGPSCRFTQAAPLRVHDLSQVDGVEYSVWIEVIRKFTAGSTGEYVIHSTGLAWGGARRLVKATVEVETSAVPRGIYAADGVEPGGSGKVVDQSIFTTGCVYKRNRLTIRGFDESYGIPAAVHSSQYITEAQSNTACTQANSIHSPTKQQPTVDRDCNVTVTASLDLRFDQDAAGGPLGASSCRSALTAQSTSHLYDDFLDTDADGHAEVKGSRIRDDAALFDVFGIHEPALDQAQLDQLRSIAEAQGNDHYDSESWEGVAIDEDHAVLYFDLTNALPNKRNVDLKKLPEKFQRVPSSDLSSCPNRSLIVIIEDGNASLEGTESIAASVFLISDDPRYGNLNKATGTGTFTGTVYANTVDLTGTSDFHMDDCFRETFSPALLEIDVVFYLEDDS